MRSEAVAPVSSVPILDDAWMTRRQQMRYWEARMDSDYLYGWGRIRDRLTPVERLREDYALGKIDLSTFERRLDKVL